MASAASESGAGAGGSAKRQRSTEETFDTSLKTVIDSTNIYSEPPTEDAPFICTHHGTFHCDESLACGMLKLLPEYRDMPIVRTRDEAVFGKAAIVVDVGAVYDPETRRYDHHQRTFSEVYDTKHGIKMSSAGLVYKHHGADIIRALVGEVDDATVDVLVKRVYTNFIIEIDAIDNGIETCDGAMRYNIHTNLSARVSKLNPSWNDVSGPDVENSQFRKAVWMCVSEFVAVVRDLFYSWLPARTIVADAISKASSVDPSGKILRLERFCPWKSHLFAVEEELGLKGHHLYVLYADSRGAWRIQCIPAAESSFESRKKLPADWCGLRDGDLDAKLGFPGAIFVHAGGFIGGHKEYDGALRMATMAVKDGPGEDA